MRLEPTFRFEPPYGFGNYDPKTLLVHASGVYLAGSVFVIAFTFVVLAERKSRQQAEMLAKQVETLAASLERTRIARDIHDSLGHTLTDLDIQLEVVQALRHADLNQSFQAIDNAKLLSKQCIYLENQTPKPT
jgi:signal transduction histidine kinase